MLRQIADELDPPTSVPQNAKPRRNEDDEETLEMILPEEAIPQFRVEMPFGKYKGFYLTEVGTSYFEYLARNDFESRGPTGDLILEAIEYVRGEVNSNEKPVNTEKADNTKKTDYRQEDVEIPF